MAYLVIVKHGADNSHHTVDIKSDSTINFAPYFLRRVSHDMMRLAPVSVRGA